ncbi:pectin lyase-like superfamily protein [Actinidia rufa]|uniref:Pectate lyase n=1 Tax=Actinidia rufa TaxID=165716 RepID=A0A7J0GIP9_9ERIC|nr:pectin lyase-like superfamily protein [Actinidia rufa]
MAMAVSKQWVSLCSLLLLVLLVAGVMATVRTHDGSASSIIAIELQILFVVSCKSGGKLKQSRYRGAPTTHQWRRRAVDFYVNECSTVRSVIHRLEDDRALNEHAVDDPEEIAAMVMLLGHSDSYVRDKQMQVTIAYNHFGEGLIQRMPRCRHGYFHVVNNDYTHWEMYAIGGSANPTINSQANRYLAPTNPFAKEVTKRVETSASQWKNWNWRSEGDLLLNGAYFTPSGAGASSSYARASSLGAKSSSMIDSITSSAGVLGCRRGHQC